MNRFLLYFIIVLFPLFKVKWYYNLWFFIALLGIAFLFSKESRSRHKNKMAKNDWSFLFFIGVCLLSNVSNGYLLNGWNYIVTYAACFLFYLIFSKSLVSYQLVKRYNTTLLATTSIVFFIVLMQVLGVQAFYLSDVDKLNGNTNFEQASSTFEIRFWGPFTSSLILSTFFVGLGTYFYTYLTLVKTKTWLRLLVVLLFTTTIILTGSRSGIFIFLLTAVLVYLKQKGIFQRLVFLIGGTIMSIIVFGSKFVQESYFYSRLQNSDNDYRYLAWSHLGDLFSINPVLGVGAWNLNVHLKKLNILPGFVDPNNLAAFGHIENTYFTVLVSTGLIGFYFFMHFLIGPLFNQKNKVPSIYTPFNIAGKCAYVSILCCAFFEPSLIGSSSILILLLIFRAIFLLKSECDAQIKYDIHSYPRFQPSPFYH